MVTVDKHVVWLALTAFWVDLQVSGQIFDLPWVREDDIPLSRSRESADSAQRIICFKPWRVIRSPVKDAYPTVMEWARRRPFSWLLVGYSNGMFQIFDMRDISLADGDDFDAVRESVDNPLLICYSP